MHVALQGRAIPSKTSYTPDSNSLRRAGLPIWLTAKAAAAGGRAAAAAAAAAVAAAAATTAANKM